jgi:hypothetical protein
MIPGILEKFGHVLTVTVMYAQGRIASVDAQQAVPDFLLGVLFVAAFVTTSVKAPTRA